ncbi:MAG: YcjF family protein [Paracoccaceae bacterium]
MTDAPRRAPLRLDLDEGAAPAPQDAPPVGREAAMERLAQAAAAPPNRLARLFWSLAATLIGIAVATALYAWVEEMLERAPLLGWILGALVIAFAAVCAALALRELLAIRRLAKLEHLHEGAAAALIARDADAARAVARQVAALYADRPETEAARARLDAAMAEAFDADAVLAIAEDTILAPLDARAQAQVEAATRQVAAVTAVVPLAFADVFAALSSNLSMIRRVAEVYGGRSGTLGAWRLTRAVLSHLVATGAVAVGDDLIGSVAGGGVLARVSRRFGEGVINGALTARVGLAAMEVCRPLPFAARPSPRITTVLRRSMTGLFERAEG